MPCLVVLICPCEGLLFSHQRDGHMSWWSVSLEKTAKGGRVERHHMFPGMFVSVVSEQWEAHGCQRENTGGAQLISGQTVTGHVPEWL